MLSFIMYDDKNSRRDLYMKLIKNFLYSSKDKYRFYEFDKYTRDVEKQIKMIEGARIYLINLDVPGPNGLSIARRIREHGDFVSPIILLTSKNTKEFIDNLKHILYLDIVKTDDNLIKNLTRSIKEAYRISTRHTVYTFSIFDEVYRIPYNDIYYITKNIHDDSVTIYTKDDSYLHYITIKALELELADARFLKVHRSCIINMYNVSSYDKKANIVSFKNGMTVDLVSVHFKSTLAKKLAEFNK